jgi:hypothetical protein
MILLVVEAQVKPKSVKFISKGEAEMVLTKVKVVRGDPVELQKMDSEHLIIHLCNGDHQPENTDENKGKTGRMFTSDGGVVKEVMNEDGTPIEGSPQCWCSTCKSLLPAGEEREVAECEWNDRWKPCATCGGVCPPGEKCPRYVPIGTVDDVADEWAKSQEFNPEAEDSTGQEPGEGDGEVPDASEIDPEEVESEEETQEETE